MYIRSLIFMVKPIKLYTSVFPSLTVIVTVEGDDARPPS